MTNYREREKKQVRMHKLAKTIKQVKDIFNLLWPYVISVILLLAFTSCITDK